MKRMTLVHERDSRGEDFYRFGAAASNATPENEKNTNKPKAKDAKTRDVAADAKTNGKSEEAGGQQKSGNDGKGQASPKPTQSPNGGPQSP